MPRIDSAGHTHDIRTALLYLSAKYPRAPLLGVGFSLGAGVLTRYVGEEGSKLVNRVDQLDIPEYSQLS